LRRRTDYAKDTGYSPLYHAALAELPRLSGGTVCTHFLLMLNMLSYGRPDKPAKGRHVWTEPVTLEYLAELCRCHLRDIQRQVANLGKATAKNPDGRGLVQVKAHRRGEYSFRLLYEEWAKLPDYVAPSCKVVSIEEPEADDEETIEVSREAVRLLRRPQKIRGGKACRAIGFKVGVKDMRIQHKGSSPLIVDAVVDVGGRLIINTEIEGEAEANAKRHGCRDTAAAPAAHPKAAELVKVFDPLLEKWGSRLLSGDGAALDRACRELGDMPLAFLTQWLMDGDKARGTRSISGPKVVASIVREAVVNWRASNGKPKAAARPKAAAAPRAGFREGVKSEILRRLRDHGQV
jgi:hypothetical protein